MKIEICEEFFYRVSGVDILKTFNTCKENIFRNNSYLNIYNGEWVKIKINNFKKHSVKPMETLEKIAKQYGLSEDQILEDNKLKSRKLFIGQILRIYGK